MPRHPSHAPDPVTGQCRVCGMTHEEMADFDIVECGDVMAAEMPWPGKVEFHTGWHGLTPTQHHQRGLILDGLLRRAERRKRSRSSATTLRMATAAC